MTAKLIATSRYDKDVRRLLTLTERSAMEMAIASDPEAHPIVAGTGGVRKARWGRQGKGKSGGVRIIYYYWASAESVYLLWVYAKKDKSDMTAAERKAAKKFVEALRNA